MNEQKAIDYYVLDILNPGLEISLRTIKASTPENLHPQINEYINRLINQGEIVEVKKEKYTKVR